MSTKRKRLTAAERKPQIMRSAVRALARSNYRTTSIAEIAHEAGITEPAVYRYFPTKKDLFIEIIKDVGKRLLEIWQGIVDASENPLEALGKICFNYYDRAVTRKGDLKVLFQALSEVDDKEIRNAMRTQFSNYVDLLQSIYEQALKQGLVQADLDARAAAWGFLSFGFTMNLVGLLNMEGEMSRERLQTMQKAFFKSQLSAQCLARNVGDIDELLGFADPGKTTRVRDKDK